MEVSTREATLISSYWAYLRKIQSPELGKKRKKENLLFLFGRLRKKGGGGKEVIPFTAY